MDSRRTYGASTTYRTHDQVNRLHCNPKWSSNLGFHCDDQPSCGSTPSAHLRDYTLTMRCDCRSLGCCFWELSSGKPAFQAFNLEGLEKKIIQGQVSALPKHHTSEWVQLLRSMLLRNPERRASVASLLRDPCMQAATGMARARRGQVCDQNSGMQDAFV